VATYAVNGLGQRVSKSVNATTTRFVYNEQGKLIGEYDGTGQLVQETVWLDELPVATLRPTGTGTPTPIATYYVHADHLGTPRAITRPADDVTMWRWDNVEAFGNHAADENPAGAGILKFGLRFPGQFYDSEVGTNYNYFRDYDPAIGRYLQSDPIGLDGGINTYLYANADPLSTIDPTGENPVAGIGTVVGAAAIRICMKIPACRAKFAEYAAKAAELCKSVECEVRFDRKGHPFPAAGGGIELCMHWQIDCHIKGVKGAGFSIHSKLPICWKPGTPFPPERPPPTLP
jgi:RHS repeat-associated protein